MWGGGGGEWDLAEPGVCEDGAEAQAGHLHPQGDGQVGEEAAVVVGGVPRPDVGEVVLYLPPHLLRQVASFHPPAVRR